MNITQEFDTIAAISTPIGTGGVGVIRISGSKSFEIIAGISDKTEFPAGRICHGWILDDKVKIDEVVILPFKAPNSYTGEDVIEIQCHGGINVVQNILNVVSQAEAVDDLIHAKTSKFAIQSAKNLSGVLRTKIGEIKFEIFDTASKIVAGIDFPEDVEEPEYSYLIESFTKSLNDVNKLLSYSKSSDIMRQGINIAIVGRPNVGKSSLFNALLNLDRAIVTDIAGTTRDIIKETLDLGVSATLIDTAGIRESADIDKVEEIGIEYSKQSAKEADLNIFLYDASTGLIDEDKEIYEIVKNTPHITAASKIDLVDSSGFQTVLPDTVCFSTRTKAGLDELRNSLKTFICTISPDDTEFVTNKRQQTCLIRCKEALENALSAAQHGELQDMIYIDLKTALLSLDEITGEVINDEILNNIFDNFCIGK